MTTLTYTNCYGQVVPLSSGHLSEMIDRLHCIQEMIHHLIENHPAAPLVQQDVEDAQVSLYKAYNHVARIQFDHFERGDK